MEINRTFKWFYALTALWVVLLFSIGIWWLYLVFQLHSVIKKLNLPELTPEGRFLNMIKWEGSFFFFLLSVLGASLFYMYFRDSKKSKSISIFFASLSHELKTPLASMRLQAEVIRDLIKDENHSHEQLENLTSRLIHDTYKFETELEKSLQLARVEQDGSMNITEIDWERLIKKITVKYAPHLSLEIEKQDPCDVLMADEAALSTVFKNLVENTLKHQPDSVKIKINAKFHHDKVVLTYDDCGKNFAGDIHKLGQLFYKFKSQQGSGIGLYLCSELLKKMNGFFTIQAPKGSLVFALHLPKGLQNG